MKAAIVQAAGRPPAYGCFADPEARDGETLVNVAAAALSPIVRARASGAHYSSSAQFPFVAGVDGVGRLEDGRRVYFFLPRAPFGAFAERTVVASERLIELPDDLDDVTAAAIANPGMSSWEAYSERAKLKKGETVLVNGATGASGRLAVQIARHRGAAKIIATGRKLDVLNSLGADVTVPLTSDGAALENAFKAQFAQGVDVVIDYLWGASAQSLLIAAAKAGAEARPIRFVQVGSSSGADINLPSAVLRSSAIEMMGSGIGSVTLEKLIDCVGALFHATRPGGFTIAAKATPLADVETSWARTESAERLVFTMDGASA